MDKRTSSAIGSIGIVFIILCVGMIASPTTAADGVPVANFSGLPLTGPAPLPVTFTDTSTGGPSGWAWFFGDEPYTGAWTRQTPGAGWSARAGHTSVVMPDGSIVLMGGVSCCSPETYFNDVYNSTDNGATWNQVKLNDGNWWLARSGLSSVVMPDGSIVLMGGLRVQTWFQDVWNSTDKGATWTPVNASAGWSVRDYHTSVVLPDGSIVLMGGRNSGSAIPNGMNDVWRSNDKGATWAQVNASAGWSVRYGQTGVVMPDGSIVLMGGTNDTVRYNDVWQSIDKGATWTQVKPNDANGWSARAHHTSVVMPDGSIVLMGGYDGATKNDVWRSTDKGATWTQIVTTGGILWLVRNSHTSVAMPDGSIVLMGGNSGLSYYNDVWRLDPTGSSNKNPSHTYTVPGTYQVALQSYNTEGYSSKRVAGYITVGYPAPTFSSIAPSFGPNAGGTSVIITGGNLTGATSVTFGGTAGTIVSVDSPTKITATTPFHTTGAVDVVVTTPNGTATGPGAFTYITPMFSGIVPLSGPIAGGTAVTITGKNLFGATAVTFDGTAATGFTVVSGTSVTATTPAHTAGAVNVVITTPNGTTTEGDGRIYVH